MSSASQAHRFHLLAKSLPDVVARFDRRLRCLCVSGAIEEVTGLRASAFLGKTNREAGVPEDLATRWDAAILAVFQTGATEVLEFAHVGPSGPVELEARLVPERAADGSIETVLAVTRNITELRQAVRGERKGEESVRGILDSLTAHIAVLDEDGTIRAVNRAWHDFARVHGAPAWVSAGIGANYLDVARRTIGADAPLASRAVEGILAVVEGRRTEFSLEYPYHTPTEQRWFLMQVSLLAAGVRGVVVSHTEITARVQSEATLRESEERYRSLFENSLDAVLLTIPDGRVLAANAAACRMFGRTEAEICRAGRSGLVDTSDPRLAGLLAQRAATGRARGEATFVRGDGTRFLGEVSSGVFQDRHGSPRTSMIIRDITERKQADDALHSLSLFNQGILDALTANICVLDADGTIVAVNRAWRDFAAANPPMPTNADVGANYFAVCEAVIGEDATAATAAVRDLCAVGRGELNELSMEYPCHSPEVRRWFMMRATRLADDRQARIVVAHFNITARKRAEEALRESEERYRAVVEDQTEVICRFRADGTFTFVNDVYCCFFGKTRQELLGRQWQPRAVADDLPMIEAKLATLSPDNPVILVENRVYSQTGEVRWMQFINRAFFGRDGQLREIQSVGRDITDRRRMEVALEELSRRQMEVQEEEQRRLARELHDEVGQLLTGLRLTLDTLAATLSPKEQHALRDAREMVAELVREVREMSLSLRPPVLDDFGLLPALLGMFERYTARTQIQVKFAHAGLENRPCEPQVETAAYRIVQEALTNVARHASVTEVDVKAWVESRRLLVRIEDRGRGFTPEMVAARGSSGLPGMRERANLVGGCLTVEAAPGAGTQILAELPLPRGTAR